MTYIFLLGKLGSDFYPDLCADRTVVLPGMRVQVVCHTATYTDWWNAPKWQDARLGNDGRYDTMTQRSWDWSCVVDGGWTRAETEARVVLHFPRGGSTRFDEYRLRWRGALREAAIMVDGIARIRRLRARDCDQLSTAVKTRESAIRGQIVDQEGRNAARRQRSVQHRYFTLARTRLDNSRSTMVEDRGDAR